MVSVQLLLAALGVPCNQGVRVQEEQPPEMLDCPDGFEPMGPYYWREENYEDCASCPGGGEQCLFDGTCFCRKTPPEQFVIPLNDWRLRRSWIGGCDHSRFQWGQVACTQYSSYQRGCGELPAAGTDDPRPVKDRACNCCFDASWGSGDRQWFLSSSLRILPHPATGSCRDMLEMLPTNQDIQLKDRLGGRPELLQYDGEHCKVPDGEVEWNGEAVFADCQFANFKIQVTLLSACLDAVLWGHGMDQWNTALMSNIQRPRLESCSRDVGHFYAREFVPSGWFRQLFTVQGAFKGTVLWTGIVGSQLGELQLLSRSLELAQMENTPFYINHTEDALRHGLTDCPWDESSQGQGPLRQPLLQRDFWMAASKAFLMSNLNGDFFIFVNKSGAARVRTSIFGSVEFPALVEVKNNMFPHWRPSFRVFVLAPPSATPHVVEQYLAAGREVMTMIREALPDVSSNAVECVDRAKIDGMKKEDFEICLNYNEHRPRRGRLAM